MNQTIDLYDQRQASGQLGSYGSAGYYLQQIPLSRPSARELVIQWLAAGKISLDYGEEIRLLMAEPVKGMKLREAIQLLKEALCHNLDPRQ